MKKVALVTGSSSGFGLLTAVELARRGYEVVASMRNLGKEGALLSAAQRAGVSLRTVRLDVTNEASVARAVEQVLEASGRIDVLVNNAGVAIGGFLEDMSSGELREQFETNVFGVFAVTRAVLPSMRARRAGRIINVSSVAGRVGSPGLSAYCATKFAIEGASEALRHELSPFGIKVVLIEPGSYPTEIFTGNRRLAANATERSPYHLQTLALEQSLTRSLRKRRADPREVAIAVADAAQARRPSLRYAVGAEARTALLARGLLPDGIFLPLAARQFSAERG